MSVCTGRVYHYYCCTAGLLWIMQKATMMFTCFIVQQLSCGKALSIYPSGAGVVALLLWACVSIPTGDDQSQAANSIRRTGSCRRACSVIHTHTPSCCPLLHACTLFVLATSSQGSCFSGQCVGLHYRTDCTRSCRRYAIKENRKARTKESNATHPFDAPPSGLPFLFTSYVKVIL